MTDPSGASRRHARRQVAVGITLVGTALVVLAVAPTLVRGDANPSRKAVVSATGPPRDVDMADVVTALATAAGNPGSTPRPAAAPTPTSSRTVAATPAPAPAATSVPAPPVAVEIPVIGVVSDLVELDLDDDRHLEVPADPDLAGWYVRGPRPGEDGSAVIAGHVDSTRGPAVFWRLVDLRAGDRVEVHRADGTVLGFVVDQVGRWPKSDFPTDLVYRQSEGPELRLITCGGTFDDRTRSYRDNVVVFASMVNGAGRPVP